MWRGVLGGGSERGGPTGWLVVVVVFCLVAGAGPAGAELPGPAPGERPSPVVPTRDVATGELPALGSAEPSPVVPAAAQEGDFGDPGAAYRAAEEHEQAALGFRAKVDGVRSRGVSGRSGDPVGGLGSAVPVEELVAERSERVTVFGNLDGSKTAVVSSAPVRFRDGSGRWRSVDTGLALDLGRLGGLRSTANSWVARFGRSGGEGVSVESGAGSVSFRPLEGADVWPVVDPGDRSVAVYRDVWPGVDLRYRVFAEGVKEEIVIRRRQERSSFGFVVSGG